MKNQTTPPAERPAAADAGHRPVFVSTSFGISRIPHLNALLEGDVVHPGRRYPVRRIDPASTAVFLGWGRKPSGIRAQEMARSDNGQALFLEDGFVRSFGTGAHFPPLSVVVDPVGIHYDALRPSFLEQLLASDAILIGPEAGVSRAALEQARAFLLEHEISKYNHAPRVALPGLAGAPTNRAALKRVLVVDQTAGDLSVKLGHANKSSFAAMLEAARAEHPDAQIIIKTHPEVSTGHKRGYLCEAAQDGRTVMLNRATNPIHLLKQVDHVYVVSSQMGFEALLAGKPVTTFGAPWYAGWGVTDDRLPASAFKSRSRQRSVDELFSAAYFHYTRYLDPITHRAGTLFDVMRWVHLQQKSHERFPGRMLCIGFRKWKAAQLAPMLSLEPKRVLFFKDAQEVSRFAIRTDDRLVVWGAPNESVIRLSERTGAPIVRLEDGFLRSVGLGSDLVSPMSLVMDDKGLYFDARTPSGLEEILNTAEFSDDEIERARKIRRLIVERGLSKYNMDSREPVDWRGAAAGRPIILVPGQVEDDKSILFGSPVIQTNLALLEKVRQLNPDAFIVYKPHPDVVSGNRIGRIALKRALRFADRVEVGASIVSCIEASDAVHTMTSLAGFDALLRGKAVHTYGQPFYAGWGLTNDLLADSEPLQRRTCVRTLDELVAATLLRYPIYWDATLNGYTHCEAVIERIVESLKAAPPPSSGISWIARRLKKLALLAKAF